MNPTVLYVRSLRALFLAVVFCCCGNIGAAQTEPGLFADIEQTFRTHQPEWKIERIVRSRTSPFSESITFRRGEQQAAVQIFVWERLKDVREMFAGQVIAYDNVRGKSATKRRIPKLGDANYIWTNRNSDAFPMIYFRKEKVFVSVFAPSVSTGKDFAKLVLEQLTTKR